MKEDTGINMREKSPKDILTLIRFTTGFLRLVDDVRDTFLDSGHGGLRVLCRIISLAKGNRPAFHPSFLRALFVLSNT